MNRFFVRFATLTAKVAGKPWTFIGCVLIVLLWAVTGPIFKFNETWQLVINTGTTIITFLMVFLIQNTQNRDGAAMQAKLDELVFAVRAADARFIGIEHLTEDELDKILEEVEARGAAVHSGKPARAIKGRPARKEISADTQPGAAKSSRTSKARV
ncbi:low affinity iron permease family protein [Brevundimonas sp. NPDC092305]|uniref:low affinity iron permease family protein n=1 Tax=Brevundimonas sp. NPDC092305 TaxID=3363957 RepID=UPI0037FD4559